jgi:hypothetical protein
MFIVAIIVPPWDKRNDKQDNTLSGNTMATWWGVQGFDARSAGARRVTPVTI